MSSVEMPGDPRARDSDQIHAWIHSELLDVRQRAVHPRVRRALQHLHLHFLERHETSLTRLAQVAGLSPSRLMHVFTPSVGIPLRPYVMWLRVQRAAQTLAAGHTATEAAHMAGFADAPHLARTFRRTLGLTPSQFVASSIAPVTAKTPGPPCGEHIPRYLEADAGHVVRQDAAEVHGPQRVE
jgi:AraC-like DNA-binding protein